MHDEPRVGDRIELGDGLVVVVTRITRKRGRWGTQNVDLYFTHPDGFEACVRWSGFGLVACKLLVG